MGNEQFKVVIVGGGVAALEAALGLQELAHGRTEITMIAAAEEFVYRPLRVREPFAGPLARSYALSELADALGVNLERDTVVGVDPDARTVQTAGGREHRYDALLLALGARPQASFDHATTLDDQRLDAQLQGLIQDVEGGYAERLAFLAPPTLPWPLPLYELALMTARRAWSMGMEPAITIATPEPSPLAIFGDAVSARVAQLLSDFNIEVVTDVECLTPEPNYVEFLPSGEVVAFDRILAMPALRGPALAGLPSVDPDGFIPVDAFSRVPGLVNVFAAGDATDLPVKHGGLAAQQADVAAAGIAALAGAPVRPEPLHGHLRAILLSGTGQLFLSADLDGGNSSVSDEPTWSPARKIDARRLTPFLERLDRRPVESLT